MNASCALGVDVFAKWDEKDSASKLSLFNKECNETPLLFAASPKSSIISAILMESFKRMNGLKVTEQGVDENENEFFPACVIDCHAS